MIRLSLPLLLAFLCSWSIQTTHADSQNQNRPGSAELEQSRQYLTGKDLPKDVTKAFALMQQAAEAGHPDALGGMGYFYAEGVAVAPDETLAVDWFRRGAEAGSAKAQFNLGRNLLKGIGTEKNESEGFVWISKSADQGLMEAIVAMGNAYYFGDSGALQDYGKAYSYFLIAAEDGHLESQNTLGVMLQNGFGIESDTTAAGKWFRQAALAGHPMAQYNLAYLLDLEATDPQVRIEALSWLMISAARGYGLATRSLDEVTPVTKAEELEAARKIASTYSPQSPGN